MAWDVSHDTKPCPCGKGKIQIESGSGDWPGQYYQTEEMLCSDCKITHRKYHFSYRENGRVESDSMWLPRAEADARERARTEAEAKERAEREAAMLAAYPRTCPRCGAQPGAHCRSGGRIRREEHVVRRALKES